MAVTSATSPGTAANDASVGTIPWGGTADIVSSNDTRATASLAGSDATLYMKATNYSFAIPSGSTIEGILVEVERRKNSGAGTITDNNIRLVKAGTITGKNLASPDTWPAADAYASYGGFNETWGVVWTADDINAADFGVVVSAQETAASAAVAGIDHIRITVWYTDPYESAPQVQEDGVVRLYGHAYRVRGAVRVTQATQWPGKVVIGEFGKADTPFISEYSVEDLRGGMGLYRYPHSGGTPEQLDRSWTGESSDLLWGSAMTLALATPSIGRPIDSTLKTTDGGANWTAQAVGATSTIRGIAAASTSVVWMVGDGGAIFNTTDGGTTWTAQTSGVATDLLAVAAASTSVAWAVGNSGVILATTDGGTTWTAQTSETVQIINGVAAASTSVAWAVRQDDTIMATTDGGANWSVQSAPSTGVALLGVAAASTSVAWAVSTDGDILATTDGGANWSVQSAPSTGVALLGVAAASTSVAWAVSAGGDILATTDGGANWSAQTSGTSAQLNGVAAASTSVAWAVGAGGVIRTTTDGGANWSGQTSGTSADINAVAEASTSVAWAGGAIDGVTDASPILSVLDNTLVAAYGAQVWQYTSSAWSARVDTLPATPVGNPVVFATNLHWPLGADGYSFQAAPGSAATDVGSPDVLSFVVWDNKLYALDTNFVLYSSTTGASASWTTLAGITLDTTFTTTYGQLVVYDDAEGNPVIWALTHQGPFVYDAINSKWFRSRYQFPYNAVGTRIAYGAPFGDSLFVLSGPTEITKLTMGGNTLLVQESSPSEPDGFPSTLAGATLNNWAASDRFLFVLLSSSTRNALLLWNGRGWHPYFVSTVTSSQPTKGITLLGDTLYFADYDEDGGSGNIVRSLLLGSAAGLRANPRVSTTRVYATAGHHIYPDFDAGYEAQTKTALALKVKVRGLASTSETVQVDYAVDGSDTFTQLGATITSTTSGITSGVGEITLRFGTNNRGLAFQSIRFRLTLASGGSTDAPVIEYIAMQFYKNPDVLWGYALQLDMTGPAPDGRSPRQQIDDLKVAVSSPTLGTFAYRDDAENVRSYMVKVLNPSGVEQTGPDESGMFSAFIHEMAPNGD